MRVELLVSDLAVALKVSDAQGRPILSVAFDSEHCTDCEGRKVYTLFKGEPVRPAVYDDCSDEGALRNLVAALRSHGL